MDKILRRVSMVFSAGCAGGLANSITVWLFGLSGVTIALGVNIAPTLTPAWLYPRIVWGGMWGGLFLLPFCRDSFVKRGLLYSLGPTAVQLLIILPFQAKKGLWGLDVGVMTPLFVIFFNAIWGLKAAYLLKRMGKNNSSDIQP